MDVGLVGLGLMGSAMATRLLADGHAVHGFDVADAACRAHEERGGTVAGSAAEVAARSDVVVLSLPSGAISRAACLEAGGVREGADAGTVVVETSTVLPDDAERLAADLGTAGVDMVDAALSGSSDMVGRGEALGMVGGEARVSATVEPVLRAFCFDVRHVGGHGDGMRAKLVVNEVLGINRFALAEGLVFAEKMGLDSAQMLAVLKGSAASSKAMGMWGARMLERRYDDPVSRVSTHNKDAQLILEQGRRHGAPMFSMTMLNNLVQVALANGYADADNAAIVELLRWMAGLSPGLALQPDAGRAEAAG